MAQPIQSDERLVELASRGDRRALAAIFMRYREDLFRYCAALLGSSEDAADALQSTMVKVLRTLPGERRRIRLKPWLYRIAHNESVELLRKRRDYVPIDAEALVGADGPESAAEARERLRQLIADLRELPERQRGGLVMRELGGLSFEEIGIAFETSGGVARQTVYEARVGLEKMERGRSMECEEVRRKLSDGDRRVIRRRDVSAHLRGCAECRDFETAIADRRADLAAISPIPALAAAGLLKGALDGAASSGGVAAGAGAAGGGLSAAAALKAVATVALVGTIGIGAADRTGVVRVLDGSGAPRSAAVPEGRGLSAAAPAASRVPRLDPRPRADHPPRPDRSLRGSAAAKAVKVAEEAGRPVATTAGKAVAGAETGEEGQGIEVPSGAGSESPPDAASQSHGHGPAADGGGHDEAGEEASRPPNSHGGNPKAKGGNPKAKGGNRKAKEEGEAAVVAEAPPAEGDATVASGGSPPHGEAKGHYKQPSPPEEPQPAPPADDKTPPGHLKKDG